MHLVRLVYLWAARLVCLALHWAETSDNNWDTSMADRWVQRKAQRSASLLDECMAVKKELQTDLAAVDLKALRLAALWVARKGILMALLQVSC